MLDRNYYQMLEEKRYNRTMPSGPIPVGSDLNTPTGDQGVQHRILTSFSTVYCHHLEVIKAQTLPSRRRGPRELKAGVSILNLNKRGKCIR